MISYLQNKFIISVGDATTEKLLSFNIIPNLAIIDKKERRTKKEITFDTNSLFYNQFRCKNEAGTISDDAINVIKKAIVNDNNSIIIVDGEEDLLTLVAISLSKEDYIVVYGQPLEGMVLINVDNLIMSQANYLISKIKK